MSKTETVKLTEPIKAHGEDVTELHLRRPKLKDLRGLNLANLDGGMMIDLVAKLADIPPSAAGEIDAADFDAIGEVFNRFFPGQAAGSESSPKSPSDTASDGANSGS